MKRRTFLYLSGITVTTCATVTVKELLKEENNTFKRINPDNFQEPVLKGIAYGMHAPNPHNTQAWKFELISEKEMLFFVDETRLLEATDPINRQIHVGCGCFLECSKLGMTLEGYSTKIEFFPNSINNYQKGVIGKEPIAKITYQKTNDIAVSPLAKYLFNRSTSRLMFTDDSIEDREFESILKIVNPQASEIQLINNTERLNILLPILSEGMSVEAHTYRTHEESRKWFRENDALIEKERDGINLPGNGVRGIKKWFAERHLEGLPKKEWHSKKMNEYSLKAHNERVISSKGIITLKTSNNTCQDWLNAGIEYLRLELACHHYGYFLHPLSQVLQEFKEMKKLRLQFEKQMNVNGNEKIQMAVRIGKSKVPYLSYRRLVNEVVVNNNG